MTDIRPVALIPAYKPEPVVVDIAFDLVSSNRFQRVVAVNDGSGPRFDAIFKRLKEVKEVELLIHPVNLGKGSALKTGMNYVANRFSGAVGIVSLDADGQHLAPDVVKVADKLIKNPHNLVLGSREFEKEVPFPSRFGNLMTRGVMRVVGGLSLRDTQTGLRGIPMQFIGKLLKLKTSRYEFELDMLLHAKVNNILIFEVPIKTVYYEKNKSSHFNPMVDSARIYFVIFKHFCSSLFSRTI